MPEPHILSLVQKLILEAEKRSGQHFGHLYSAAEHSTTKDPTLFDLRNLLFLYLDATGGR